MSIEEQAFQGYREGPGRDRLRTLLQTQQDRVYNLCFQVLRHSQDAEDAAQKVLLKLAEGIGDLPDATALRRWLYRVCVTTALDARTERSRRRAREREVAMMRKTESTPEPEGEGELLGAIGSLDADAGDLILRHYFEKVTLKELAAERQVSEVAVWKRIEKGKGKLRELLSTSGAAMSTAALDLRLASIVPVQAPAAWAAALAAKAGAGWGGLAVAAKGLSSAKTVAACIGLLAVGLGGGIYLAGARTRPEAVREHPDLSAARPRQSDPILAAPATAVAQAPAPAPAASAVPAAPAPAGKSDDDLRELLRKLARVSMKAKREGDQDLLKDPEGAKLATSFIAEYGAMMQAPATNPSGFARITRLTLEAMFEEFGVPLTESQKTGMAATFERLRSNLDQVHGESVQDQSLGQLRAYRELISGLKVLTEEQIAKMSQFTTPSTMFPIDGTRTVLLNGVTDPAEEVLRAWTDKYQIVDSQKAAAASAARTFVETWDQVDRRFEAQYGHRPGEKPAGSSLNNFIDQAAAATDYAIASFEAQRDALRLLEGGLTPDQLEKVRGTTMNQFKRVQVKVVTVGGDR